MLWLFICSPFARRMRTHSSSVGQKEAEHETSSHVEGKFQLVTFGFWRFHLFPISDVSIRKSKMTRETPTSHMQSVRHWPRAASFRWNTSYLVKAKSDFDASITLYSQQSTVNAREIYLGRPITKATWRACRSSDQLWELWTNFNLVEETYLTVQISSQIRRNETSSHFWAGSLKKRSL